VAEHLCQFEALQCEGETTFRGFSACNMVPKSTLNDWVHRKAALAAEVDPVTANFLESPQGLALLHAVVLAAHFAFSFLGHAGIRRVTHFLELAGLAPFVATSYGAHQTLADTMTEQILAFEEEQRPMLARAMPRRTLTVCEDETFPKGKLCLVVKDPVSGFLLAEQFEEKRDAATWNAVLDEATADLNVHVIQQTSDEASALLAHARRNELHHSPDLFHILHDINKATVLPLKRRKEGAAAQFKAAKAETTRYREEHAAYVADPHPSGSLPDLQQNITRAEAVEAAAKERLEEAEGHCQLRHDAVAGISENYHPFDMVTGAPRRAREVETTLTVHFDALEQLADDAVLPDRSRELLAKSRRRLPQASVSTPDRSAEWMHGRGCCRTAVCDSARLGSIGRVLSRLRTP